MLSPKNIGSKTRSVITDRWLVFNKETNRVYRFLTEDEADYALACILLGKQFEVKSKLDDNAPYTSYHYLVGVKL